jgi:tRNA threonylcarbamoyl adenosine modification protein (Sua5/YciO/YrdC/YwlC family)
MILHTNPLNPQKRHIQRVVEILKQGGLICYPTDTTYGIACDILNKRAIEKVYAIKKKEKHQPVSIVCADLKDLAKYAVVSNAAYRILRKYLPGPYTFILPATLLVPKIMLTPRKTVGIRVPENQIVHDIIQALGRPLINTSVTLEDGTILKDPQEIERIYRGKIDTVIAAECPGELSSIIDLVDDEPAVIRKGLGDLSWLE